MFYLTYAEPPSGVYYSQVTNVIQFLRSHCNANLRLVAFISLHDFSAKRKLIKQQLPDAIVLPMLPKAPYWKFNNFILWLLCLIYRPKTIISRNVIAANMSINVRGLCSVKKVCFDGRGAMEAEWHEYEVTVPESWKKSIYKMENIAVNKSDFRIAVTQKLVEHWQSRYKYNSSNHVVIPCTLNSSFKAIIPTIDDIIKVRASIGINPDDTVLAYSGSTSGWQSFSILYTFLSSFLRESDSHKVIFLAQEEENITKLQSEFPHQVQRKWVNHEEVTAILTACDTGILIREQSVTNQVASPTKFAEYLSAGLTVIISENLGDYSDFVRNNNCGTVVNGDAYPKIKRTDIETRARMISLVKNNWTKEAQLNNYKKLLSAIQ